MAADQTQVVLDLAQMLVNESGSFMNSIEEFENVYEWASAAGIIFTDYETDIESQANLMHAVGANYNWVGGVIVPAVIAWLKAQTISSGPLNGKTYWEALQMLRRNGDQT